MTNKKQIQTKKISFILALSVIIYAAIDTYLFLCHDINIMRITTPVILGLVIAIILCGLLHKFFYKWLTKNPINFSFGEPSTPIVKSENIIDSLVATGSQPIKQPMDLPEQESSPSQQSNQDTVNSDCPQDSHLNKYDSILVELKKKEIERKEMDLCDDLTYVGLAFMTLGMLTGAIWAKEAWGHYWAWDPKETWAAATWFSYLVYIHFRLGRPLKSRPALIILLVSFVLLQMCWYGINYLPSAQGVSVHTYNLN